MLTRMYVCFAPVIIHCRLRYRVPDVPWSASRWLLEHSRKDNLGVRLDFPSTGYRRRSDQILGLPLPL